MNETNREDTPDASLFGLRVARALGEIPEGAAELAVVTLLRRQLGADLGRRAAQLHSLRRRSRGKFPQGHLPFLTPRGLEQASSFALASERAKQAARRSRGGRVWDATSGIGADSVALASRGLDMVTSDRDPFTLRCARANLRHHGLDAHVLVAEATHAPLRDSALESVVLDPDRRPDGRRTLDPERWSPGLTQSIDLARRIGAGCVQLAPAVDPERVMHATSDADRPRLAWTSWCGELAAVDLWCGAWGKDSSEATREVVALDHAGAATRFAGEPESVAALDERAALRVTWLATPDPGLIRSGLLGALARREGLSPLAPSIAFLAGEHPPRSALLRGWRVLGTSPLDPKRVRALLRQHDVGAVQVLKRGHPDAAEVLARRFRGPGARPGWLAVARLEKGHLALLVEPMVPAESPPRGPLVGDEGFEPPTSSL